MIANALLMEAIKNGMALAGSVSLKVIIPILVVGLLVAVFQAATQINEASLSFVPKLIVIFFIVLFGGDILLGVFCDYFRHTFEQIPLLVQ